MEKRLVEDYLSLLKSEMCEVRGCTEPASIAFACARAVSVFKEHGIKFDPGKVVVSMRVSRDVYRNASTVKVPVLKIKGVKAAVVCGLFGGNSIFNPFASIDPSNKKTMMNLLQKEHWFFAESLDQPGIYVDAEIKYRKNIVRVIIDDKHDCIKKILYNGKSIFKIQPVREMILKIESMEQVIYIVKKRIPELENIAFAFLKKQARIIRSGERYGVISEVNRLIGNRMEGGNLPVQTFTGSGNQGLFLSIPFYKLYLKHGDKVIPSFLFSLLTQIYMVHKKGRISSLCGLSDKCAPSLAAGLSYFKGYGIDKIFMNMNLAGEVFNGMFCDGAKKSCADKGVAVMGYVMRKFYGDMYEK